MVSYGEEGSSLVACPGACNKNSKRNLPTCGSLHTGFNPFGERGLQMSASGTEYDRNPRKTANDKPVSLKP